MVLTEVDRALQTLRIIIAAMALGVSAFGAVVVFLVAGGSLDGDPQHW